MNKWFIASTISVLMACSGDTAPETKDEAPAEVKEDAAPKQMKKFNHKNTLFKIICLHWFDFLFSLSLALSNFCFCKILECSVTRYIYNNKRAFCSRGARNTIF